MKGILTSCITDKQKEIELGYEIENTNDNQTIFQLIGGPTGYESFFITDKTIKRMIKEGWTACAGTKLRWDHLFIPAEEMRRVFEQSKLTK